MIKLTTTVSGSPLLTSGYRPPPLDVFVNPALVESIDAHLGHDLCVLVRMASGMEHRARVGAEGLAELLAACGLPPDRVWRLPAP